MITKIDIPPFYTELPFDLSDPACRTLCKEIELILAEWKQQVEASKDVDTDYLQAVTRYANYSYISKEEH